MLFLCDTVLFLSSNLLFVLCIHIISLHLEWTLLSKHKIQWEHRKRTCQKWFWLTLVEEHREWRAARFSAKWGTEARMRKKKKKSIVNTVQTNYNPYGAPSRLIHSKTTCDMPTSYTKEYKITQPDTKYTHNIYLCCKLPPYVIRENHFLIL